LAHAKSKAGGVDCEIISTNAPNRDPCHHDIVKTDSKNKIGDSYTLSKCVTGNMYFCKDGYEKSLIIENCHQMLSDAKEQYITRLKVANSK
jgi:hypothetical protein